jgi:predicted transcriptional regulator
MATIQEPSKGMNSTACSSAGTVPDIVRELFKNNQAHFHVNRNVNKHNYYYRVTQNP